MDSYPNSQRPKQMRINCSTQNAREQNCLINLDETNAEPGPIFHEPNTASYRQIITELSGIDFHVNATAIGNRCQNHSRPLPNLLPINIQNRQPMQFPILAKTKMPHNIFRQLYLMQVPPSMITLNIEQLIDLCGSDFDCQDYK